jgi:metal iron transporter
LVIGQDASITVILIWQIVSKGFIEWRTRPFFRRLVLRLIGIVPSAIVAASVRPQGFNELLVGCRVALIMVLPFFVLPLIIFTTLSPWDHQLALPPPHNLLNHQSSSDLKEIKRG